MQPVTKTFAMIRMATRPLGPFEQVDLDTHRRVLSPDRFLSHYLEGWASADASKIAEVTMAGYRFQDPLVGTFDRDSIQHYFAILRQRVGFESSRVKQCKVCLSPFDQLQEGTEKFRFWRTISECGLSGTSDIEIGVDGILHEVVCYDPNLATEWLRGGESPKEFARRQCE